MLHHQNDIVLQLIGSQFLLQNVYVIQLNISLSTFKSIHQYLNRLIVVSQWTIIADEEKERQLILLKDIDSELYYEVF